MPRKGASQERIVYALKQAEAGVKTNEICREAGISEQTFYNWKRKYGGMGVSELRRLRLLEEENRKLKQLVADLTLDKHILQEVVKKSSEAGSETGVGGADQCLVRGRPAASLWTDGARSIELLLPESPPRSPCLIDAN